MAYDHHAQTISCMTGEALERYPHLSRAPIRELICGLRFHRFPELDSIAHGLFYERVRSEFPSYQVQPPLNHGQLELLLPPGRTRAWFISEDDTFVLQLQDDIFYLNWRRRDSDYPRFHDEDGRAGVLSRFSSEFSRFADFCVEEFGREPLPAGLELGKINWLVEKEHWTSLTDLLEILPPLEQLAPFTNDEAPDFNVRIAKRLAENEGSLLAVLQTMMVEGEGSQPQRIINLELRARFGLEPSDEPSQVFEGMNNSINAVFDALIPSARQRFG